jgi:hypothetical protein
LNPKEIAVNVEMLKRQCQDSLSGGAVIRVVGDSFSEFSLYTVVSLTLSALRKAGNAQTVCGSPRESTAAPTRPKTTVAVLLGSDVYNSLGAWRECQPGNIVILAEHAERATGVADLVIQSQPERVAEFVEPYMLSIRRIWSENEGNRIGDGLVRCAVGVDLPPSYFRRGPIPAPFVPVRTPDDQPTGWLTVEASWLAHHALRDVLPRL